MGDEEKKEKKKKSKKKQEEAPPPAAEPAPAPAEPAPPAEEPAPAPAPEPAPTETSPQSSVYKSTSTKRRAQRTTSNIFAMFTQNKVQEFKEVRDLKLAFYGRNWKQVEDSDLISMVEEAPGPINFTMFLTIFGERIAGTDDEHIIVNAFRKWDQEEIGKIKESILRHALMSWGEIFNESEADEVLREAPIDYDGYIDIIKFTKVITKGEDDES
ncbi:myosin regulatory light chain 12B-like [Centruroides sculpturatus]|uniref:myosin regulatory light chain 12B-like n=1 Tax=Centruroides sculpturatus TaxID=218467 RepID=UPI000C6D36EB|nr:myosin regulatory light chain 12B-like [Centruroides sculpturatus]